ncbi:MAG: CBS domain-containing protein [Patescibacteria group bacterium]
MKVKHVLEKNVITIPHTATYREAAEVLHKNNLSGAPVIGEKNRLVGMLSEKDLFKVLYPFYQSYYENPELYLDYESRETKIREIENEPIIGMITKNVVTIDPEAPILRAGAIMLAKGIHRLPVVKDNKLLGIVTREHIYSAILKRELNLDGE